MSRAGRTAEQLWENLLARLAPPSTGQLRLESKVHELNNCFGCSLLASARAAHVDAPTKCSMTPLSGS